jgi:hypothetical protein
MKNKLISLLAIPMFLVGCGVAPLVKEKPIQKAPMPQRIKTIFQLEESGTFCDCYRISLIEKIIDQYKEAFEDGEKLAIEELEKGYKNQDASRIDEIEEKLERVLFIQEWLAEQKEDISSEGQNCSCYKNEL